MLSLKNTNLYHRLAMNITIAGSPETDLVSDFQQKKFSQIFRSTIWAA